MNRNLKFYYILSSQKALKFVLLMWKVSMQMLLEFLRSDALALVQVVMTLAMLVFALIFSIQVISRQNKVSRENTLLRDEISDLRVRNERTLMRLSDEQCRHRSLLSKIGDDIFDVQSLEREDFEIVRQVDGYPSSAMNVRMDNSNDDPIISLVPTGQLDLESDSFVEPDLLRNANEVVADISMHYPDLEGPIDDSINEESDPLTRALKISKAVGR